MFRSDDGGESWTRTNSQRILQQRAFYYTHIYADPVDVDTVYALNTAAYKSTDGGKTFPGAGIPLHGDNHDLWINPTNNKTMIEANDGGVGVTVNGATWSTQNNQMTQEIYRIDVDTRWPYWVYGAQQDNTLDRGAEHERRRAVRGRRRRERLPRGRPAQRQHHLRGQLRRHAAAPGSLHRPQRERARLRGLGDGPARRWT